ncbi:TRAP transporter permease [Desulfoluna sp.]|uniref:TRAP transporter permease n=1 Tax=Desulfoluna sp. TaxID=2045199 RepID=UPI0026156DB8|nr:TRAP transporter permease [Desulfoluna sp.]
MRKLTGSYHSFFYLYVIAIGVFHLYTAVFGNYEAYLQRMIHLTLVFPLAFCFFPATGTSPVDRPTWLDLFLAFLSLLPGICGVLCYEDISMRMVQVSEVAPLYFWMALLLTGLLLEATRRVVGLPLMLVAVFFGAYMYWGHLVPGVMQGMAFSLDEIAELLYLTDEGIFSIPLGVSATFVIIFLIFGGFLEKSGIGEYFMRFAQAFAGTTPGGPAKIAVVSSCLFGSISGSAVANVYGTGTFTIPLMKRIGYPSHFAGAVEAVASSGGQIMPPVMGAGAFIMASLLGIPFKTIVIAATLPAILYYVTLFLMVHLRAVKIGLRGLSAEELPSRKKVIKGLYNLIPIGVLVFMLLTGSTPMRSAVCGIVLAWVISLFNRESRMGPRQVLDAIYTGTRHITVVAIACAAAGIIVGSVSLTGVGFKFVGLVTSLAQGVPFAALMMIMVVSLILGMGLPTVGAYILAAALGVPALANLGFEPLASHLFVFYFAIISAITPPVALAAYAASSVAGSEPNRTGLQAMRLGVLAFVVPFAFCYDPGLLLCGTWVQNSLAVLGGLSGAVAFGVALEGYLFTPLSLPVRIVLIIAAVACFTPFVGVKLGGIGVVLISALMSKAKRGRSGERFNHVPHENRSLS